MMLKLELDEAINYFYKDIKPALERISYRSDNTGNFTKKQMVKERGWTALLSIR